MPTPPVLDQVKELDAALGDARPGPGAAHAVGDLQKAVATVMLEPDHAPHYASLRERLRASLTAFEAEHPALSGAVQQLLGALDAAGL